MRLIPPNTSFLTTLSIEDIGRLRKVVKRVHMRNYPQTHCTNYEADRIIESFGPDVCTKMLEHAQRGGISQGKIMVGKSAGHGQVKKKPLLQGLIRKNLLNGA